MQKIFAYIRKNIVFCILLITLIGISVIFGAYVMSQRTPTQEPNVEEKPPVEEEDTPAQITSLEGSYGKDAQVVLNWAINAGSDTITSVKLYQGGHELGGEMKNLTSYSFSQNIYQFPTGDVTFTMKVQLASGDELTQDVNVFIRYVLDIEMTSEKTEDGVLLKLSYQYDKNNPVAVPRIKLLNNQGAQPFEFAYQDTIRETNGSLENAETIYKIGTSKIAAGTYEVTIRWIFDGLNISKDFPITITK